MATGRRRLSQCRTLGRRPPPPIDPTFSDSERSGEASGFTIFFVLLCIKTYTGRSASISIYYSILSFRKLDRDDTLERSFFDFLNSYLMPREKPPTNYKKFLISNALRIAVETNKKNIISLRFQFNSQPIIKYNNNTKYPDR